MWGRKKPFYADYSNGSIGKAIKIISDEDFKIGEKDLLKFLTKD